VFARLDLGRHANAHDHLLLKLSEAGLRPHRRRFPGISCA